MSKRIEKETKCACCNKDSIQYEYMSRFIPKDSFYNRLMDIEECPHCHYVNMHINLESKRDHFRDIVNSPEYQSLFKDTASINKNEANKYKAFLLLTTDRQDKIDALQIIKYYEDLDKKN